MFSGVLECVCDACLSACLISLCLSAFPQVSRLLKKHGLLEGRKHSSKKGRNGGGGSNRGRGAEHNEAPSGIGGSVPEPDPPKVLHLLRTIQQAYGEGAAMGGGGWGSSTMSSLMTHCYSPTS